MKYIKKSIFINWKNIMPIFLLVMFNSILFASRIDLGDEGKVYPLLNRNTNKIINYYELNPGDILRAKTFEVDSLQVYSRLILNGKKEEEYSYKILVNNKPFEITRIAKKSRITRGLNGDEISGYNLYKTFINSDNSEVVITNTSQNKILFKISGNNVISDYRVIDYIRYTPQEYNEERVVLLNDTPYTYYGDSNGSIKLVLEGPIVLKIMSRIVFSRNYVNTKKYRYLVYDNDKLIGEYEEKAYKSNSAYLKDEEEKMLSTGDANILKLDRGIHNIRIENRDKHLDVIFRFYISKSSVQVEK
jgi:hypothetical protein